MSGITTTATGSPAKNIFSDVTDCSPNSHQPCWSPNITSTVAAIAVAVSRKTPLIDSDTKIILEYVIQIGTFYPTATFGIIVNIINIIVYKKQGLKDSITLGLFALSISDLFVSGLPIETATCYALKFIFPNSNIPFVSILYVHSAWSRRMFYSLSCLITAMLSLERCFCVILPFQVKVIFTRTRTAIIILILAIIHVVSFVPIFATHQLRWKNPPTQNGSRILGLWFGPHRAIIEDFNYTFMSILTPTLAQVIVTCCAVVMIHGLRQASKFRRAMTSAATTPNENKNSSNNGSQDTTKPTTTLSPRDAKLVRTMVFLVALLSACNIPYLIMRTASLLYADFNIYRAYHNTFSLIYSINFIFASLNASLNFFIYYNTSSKYREIFRQTFCCNTKQES